MVDDFCRRCGETITPKQTVCTYCNLNLTESISGVGVLKKTSIVPKPPCEPKPEVKETFVHSPIPPRESTRYYERYSKFDRGARDIIRTSQLLRESGKIALESQNPETAQSRFEFAIEMYYELMLSMNGKKQYDSFWQAVKNGIQNMVDLFPTAKCINEAHGIFDKGDKMKTPKGQLKYFLEAKKVLERGMTRSDVNLINIRNVYDQIASCIEKAEGALQKKPKSM